MISIARLSTFNECVQKHFSESRIPNQVWQKLEIYSLILKSVWSLICSLAKDRGKRNVYFCGACNILKRSGK